MTYTYTHTRAAWESNLVAYKVTGPFFRWPDNDLIVIHYTAADDLIDGDPGENWAGLPQYLRNIQKSYVDNRGYSIGYNVAVDQRGHSWELRGDDFQCAANRGVNERSFAILCLVDGNDSASPDMVAEIRRIVAWCRAQNSLTQRIVGHQEVGATGCPGAGLQWQVKHGVFEPVVEPPVPEVPEVPVTDSEVEMLALDYKPNTPEWTALMFTGTHLAHTVNGHADNVARRAGVPRQTVTRDELLGIVRSSVTTTAMPPTFSGDLEMAAAWDLNTTRI